MNADETAMTDTESPWSREGYTLLAACFEVHNAQGGGLLEEIYQESLELEFEMRGIPYASKAALPCFYKGQPLRKHYCPDFLVYGHIILELKSVVNLAPEHEAQLMNYMRLTRCCVGYLVNFGHIGKLEWKRRVLRQYATPLKNSPAPKAQ